jgi:hypothetical protein
MPGGNFNETLDVRAEDNLVIASGPLDKSVTAVTEMCVWVLQRDGADNAGDAIGNAMGPPDDMPDMPDTPDNHKDRLKVTGLGTADAKWTFPLTDRFKPVDFRAGSATAMAIGVFIDDKRKQRGFFWSEPVQIILPGTTAAS